MKEIKLTIDGKEVQLTAEQIKALGIDIDDGCVCDRVANLKDYYYISCFGNVRSTFETECQDDDERFDYGNYFHSASYAKQVALHQKLNNLLRRYSEQRGGDNEWDGDNKHYMIMFNLSGNKYVVSYFYRMKDIGTVYFNSEKVAEQAIEEVVKPFMEKYPDFVW